MKIIGRKIWLDIMIFSAFISTIFCDSSIFACVFVFLYFWANCYHVGDSILELLIFSNKNKRSLVRLLKSYMCSNTVEVRFKNWLNKYKNKWEYLHPCPALFFFVSARYWRFLDLEILSMTKQLKCY